jgi:hypothetical protein
MTHTNHVHTNHGSAAVRERSERTNEHVMPAPATVHFLKAVTA